ncbi:MAG: 50S ribosomal protein L1 [Candidatus Pacebacteria bacterium]|nr:50S ribosomal protein L1 [Candidatus Paceibacterota bacterium]
MGTKKNVTISGVDNVKIVEDQTPDSQEMVEKSPENKQSVNKKVRSKKYASAKSRLDKTQKYELSKAIALVKDLSYSKFDGTVEAHLVVKEAGISASVSFPHSTGKAVKVAIFSDAVIKDIEAGNIDFDILIATPSDMPKLTKFARVLGPKGLMPNPKSGTLTTNPEAKKKELEAGKVNIKTERKAPLMHLGVGKTSMKTEDLAENIQALLNAVGTRVQKLSISATMSPGVKVQLEK